MIEQQRSSRDAGSRAEERLRLTLDATGVGVWTLDLATDRYAFDERICALMGLPPGTTSAARDDLWAFVDASDRQRLSDAVRAALRDHTDYDIEHRIVRADGSVRWTQAKGRGEYDADGRPVHLHGVNLDITARRQVEASLREREQQLRLFVEYSPAAIAMLDRDMRYVVASRRWLTDHGLRQQEVAGRSHYELFPDIPERWKAIHRRCLEGAIERSDTDEFPRADGTTDWVRWEIRPWSTAEGRIGGLIIFSEVITARVRAQRAAQQSQQRLRQLIDGLGPEMFVGLLTPDGALLEANRPALAAAGLRLEDVLGKSLADAFWFSHSPEAQQQLRAAVARAADGEASRYDVEIRLADETRAWIDLSIQPLRDETGRVAYLVPSAVVISERKRAEEEVRLLNVGLERRVAERTAQLEAARLRAEAADRVKSEFLAAMSHELRTPLNSVIGFSGILLQELPGPLNAEQRKQLGVVRDSAHHLLALINDILDLSKIEAGELRVTAEPFDLCATLARAAEAVRPQADKKGLSLQVEIDPSLGTIRSDARRVEQIVLNLLSNAIKFTERGTVALTATRNADSIRIDVSDTGIGIRAEDQEQLFQPFHQVESGATRSYEGTGLGLAISRRLAGLLGGDVHVESRWGQGSTFSLSLPVTEAATP